MVELGGEVMNHSKETVLKTVSELFDLVKEKQSKVDELQKRIDGIKKIIREAYESDGNSSVEIVFDEVEQLEQALKGGGE